MINRKQIMTVHALLAAFILPVALMFAITGALYTWGTKGSYISDVYQISLAEPVQADVAELTKLAESELKKLSTDYPEGKPKLKIYGTHFLLEWTGSSKDIILEPTNNDLVAKLTVKKTTWYRSLVQLHKAKGGTVFKIYAAVFAVSLIAILISGFIMAWQTPRLKRPTLITSLLGFCSFIILISLS